MIRLISAFDSIPAEFVHSPAVPPSLKIQPGILHDESLSVKDRPYQQRTKLSCEGEMLFRQSKSRPSRISVKLVCGRTYGPVNLLDESHTPWMS